jgi:predicted MFS family arabinose efflux permease
MEILILGWYVLAETQSVLLLTLFGSLQYFGTLIAPVFGMAGDRVGHRTLLCAMRGYYALLAATLMVLALTGALGPVPVFVIATLNGLVRHSDLVMRNALIGETMPQELLMGAMSLSRTTSDSARIAGALTGAGVFAAFGFGTAYAAIFGLYALSLALTLGVSGRPSSAHKPDDGTAAKPSPWRDVMVAASYVWSTPALLAAMSIAFLVNLCAFPLSSGLLPYVAAEIFKTDQAGLSYLVAGFSVGALIGSVALSHYGHALRPAPMMVGFCAGWYVALLVFAHTGSLAAGVTMLAIAGLLQSLCLIPLAVLMLRSADPQMRGRVMGMRILAVYGLPIGLLAAGPSIEFLGFAATGTLYALFGLAVTAAVGFYWRGHLWERRA